MDLTDFAAWPNCATGPQGGPVDKSCAALDMDGDGDIDLSDFATLQNTFEPIGITADDCGDAQSITATGRFAFDNSAATTDGSSHTACAFFGEDQIDRDLWVCWTSACDATVFVDACGMTAVDTKIAVYEGCACPQGDDTLLACNDDACDRQSMVSFTSTAGQDYLIRVGTFPGQAGGSGSVRIRCGLASCPGSGECFASHETPGCKSQDCCETTCTRDPFCCDSVWDEVCVDEALGLCAGSFTACAKDAGDCTLARPFICGGGANDGELCNDYADCPEGSCQGQGGCDDVDCCNAVCQSDPYCCLDTWDEFCTQLEATICFGTCRAGAGDCHAPNGSAGCEDEACCAAVCSEDPFCCQVDWDATCATTAAAICP